MINTTCPNCNYCPHCGRSNFPRYHYEYPTIPWTDNLPNPFRIGLTENTFENHQIHMNALENFVNQEENNNEV